MRDDLIAENLLDLSTEATKALKPCPFCGGKAEVEKFGTIYCPTCCTEVGFSAQGISIIDAWNRRKYYYGSPFCIKDIVYNYLIANGYSALCNPDAECGCSADNDFMPCGVPVDNCLPGYWRDGRAWLAEGSVDEGGKFV